MSETTCAHCGATTSNGIALCELCQRKAATDLEFLPVYFRNLARWRPGRAGSRPVPGSRVLYDGDVRNPEATGDRISDRLDEAMNAVTTWVRMLTDDRGDFMDLPGAGSDDSAIVFGGLCAGLGKHLTTIGTLAWCGELVRDLSKHERALRRLTETAVPGWYAGSCKRQISMDHRCGSPTYVVPGLTWVTCMMCGSTTYARDHLEIVIDEARSWKAKPMDLAKALVALLDEELSVPRLNERIKKWSQRGHIDAHRKVDDEGDEVGPKRYEFGQVLDRMIADGPTRIDSGASVIAKVS